MHALTVVQFASYFECKIHCPHGTKICVEDGKRDDAYIVLLCGQSLREMTIVGSILNCSKIHQQSANHSDALIF